MKWRRKNDFKLQNSLTLGLGGVSVGVIMQDCYAGDPDSIPSQGENVGQCFHKP